eukprot:TRINITY_DN50095_c0_g1_i2.p1 TRINITY_DN50095_c0_g1~~TRINITY_DN50095_c0_g1_i2.p1  ORF type:complete len:456 (+),score=152.18 TRINITY_DN50095_c0_g1_i2:99-1466(+)
MCIRDSIYTNVRGSKHASVRDRLGLNDSSAAPASSAPAPPKEASSDHRATSPRRSTAGQILQQQYRRNQSPQRASAPAPAPAPESKVHKELDKKTPLHFSVNTPREDQLLTSRAPKATQPGLIKLQQSEPAVVETPLEFQLRQAEVDAQRSAEQLVNKMSSARIEEWAQKERSVDAELEEVRRQLSMLLHNMNLSQDRHVGQVTRIKAAAVEQVKSLQDQLAHGEEQLAELDKEIASLQAQETDPAATRKFEQYAEATAHEMEELESTNEALSAVRRQLGELDSEEQAEAGLRVKESEVRAEHAARIGMLTTLLRELQHKQGMEENRTRQSKLSSALRQEAMEREWARAEGSAVKSDLNKVTELLAQANEQGIASEAERRILLEDTSQLLEAARANVAEVRASVVFKELAAAEEELKQLKEAPVSADKELQRLAQEVALSSEEVVASEALSLIHI